MFRYTVFHRHLILGFEFSYLADFLLYMLAEFKINLVGFFSFPDGLMN